ncbi:MAG: cysteine desulfurase family protein [Anaerolineae bacterium]
MSPSKVIYLDHSASTPVDSRVIEAMMPYFSEIYGNSSSVHSFGRKAELAIEDARAKVARVLNCGSSEIVFTSGGSESDNLALRGAAWMSRAKGAISRLITTPVEHSAIYETVKQLHDVMGFEQVISKVGATGLVEGDDFAMACANRAALASIVYANNEVGTVQDISLLAALAHQNDVLFHTDAVQAAGQLSLDVAALDVDMLSLSSHKFYGPKGVGVLYVRGGIDLISNQSGGGHELGRRAGTHNTPGIVGMALALELAYAEREERIRHYSALQDMLIDGVLTTISGAMLTGDRVKRLPSHASFVFDGVESNSLLMHLDMLGIAGSSGSACTTGNPEPSDVLLAMGYSPEQALGSLRLTVGLSTTEADIEFTVNAIRNVVEKLRKLSHEMML